MNLTDKLRNRSNREKRLAVVKVFRSRMERRAGMRVEVRYHKETGLIALPQPGVMLGDTKLSTWYEKYL